MNLNQNANKSCLHYIKCYLKRSGQFPDPLDCSWLGYPDSKDSWRLYQTSPSVQQTSGTSHCGRWSDWPSRTWEQPALYLTHSPGSLLEPWGTHLEEQETNPSLTPSQSLSFFFKKPHSASPQGCSQSWLSPPASAASYKWILDQIIQLLPPPFLANF